MNEHGGSDADVIVRSAASPEAFGAIFDRYFAEVFKYVERRLGREHAEDVAAETFVIAFRRRASYDHDQQCARPWLYGIATNLIRRHRRTEARAVRALARMPANEVDNASDELANRVASEVSASGQRQDLVKALARLQRGDRDALLLRALGDLSYDEIALALGVARGTVSSRLGRARRLVRTALGITNSDVSEATHP